MRGDGRDKECGARKIPLSPISSPLFSGALSLTFSHLHAIIAARVLEF